MNPAVDDRKLVCRVPVVDQTTMLGGRSKSVGFVPERPSRGERAGLLFVRHRSHALVGIAQVEREPGNRAGLEAASLPAAQTGGVT